ncbi:CSL zinc finger [Colletotrichum higginsianum]|uniref:Diphthamide biosynthesis protein 4 n=2 Tax=Colletotrichum higginsianum TaxID=80884 RepID=H1V5L4_COLHI|nr:CSL zinc finger [Colletotrichum higginsianum IMI 349063]OBR15608.1 CSL zinc finger [Colletotrichum higginsianum IMI 349063]TID05203.1 Diphthamide biosynthesis protein 4 [Colletotrichum higginsianum]GJC92110.1 CSL zinc finger [Colletotrichum higginsianum]CCF35516.1 CSL zinc finger [Colletotrichum higginsianum]
MSPSPVDPGKGHTYYAVLGITRKLLQEEAAVPQQVIKRAYHRALLQNHPDKSKEQVRSTTSATSYANKPAFTVDQISTAYKVLSDSRTRAEYDRSLDLAPNNQGLKRGEQTFQTGIENVDLDDLDFDESDGPDAECWYRSCRCGNPRGFLFTEADLEEAGENGELLVGCQDCSLWMKVHFAIVSND